MRTKAFRSDRGNAGRMARSTLVLGVLIASTAYSQDFKYDQYDGMGCDLDAVSTGFSQSHSNNVLIINKVTADAGGPSSQATVNCPVVISNQYSEFDVYGATFSLNALNISAGTVVSTTGCTGYILNSTTGSSNSISSTGSGPPTGVPATNAYIQCNLTIPSGGIKILNYHWKMNYTNES